MNTPLIILSVVIFYAISIYILHTIMRGAQADKVKIIEEQASRIALLNTELNQERSLLNESKENIVQISNDNATLSANFGNLRERFDDLMNNEKANQEKFELLANKILEEKTLRFDQQHKEGIKEILNPLKERINRFEEKVDTTNKETMTRHTALYEQINHLKELNQQITKETLNLTKALKGDNKTQGNWGEIILESILEKSGLEKDREYFVQPSYKSNEGKQIRPDVVIHLPDHKKIVIDSKVSLTSYDRFAGSENDLEQQSALKALTISIKSHIDGLSSKNYHEIYSIESPDFVLMFIPIDTAFTAALSQNPELYTYAFDKNIVIVTSSTLLATLKTVESMWRNEKQHRNALHISEEAGKMYDKFSNLVEDLIKVGERLDSTKNIYQDSMKKLISGKGNLISRAEKMKQLGAKTNKIMNQNLVERASDGLE